MSKEKQCKCCKEYWWEASIHSQSGLCPNCYDYVADLEAKLTESEEKCNKQWLEIQAETHQIQMLEQDIKRIKKELKQQLAEKEQMLKERQYLIVNKSNHCMDKVLKDINNSYIVVPNDTEVRLIECEKCKTHNQDKILFAVEQLEKVGKKVLQETERITDESYLDFEAGFESCYIFMQNQIDNQIKQLKGKK